MRGVPNVRLLVVALSAIRHLRKVGGLKHESSLLYGQCRSLARPDEVARINPCTQDAVLHDSIGQFTAVTGVDQVRESVEVLFRNLLAHFDARISALLANASCTTMRARVSAFRRAESARTPS